MQTTLAELLSGENYRILVDWLDASEGDAPAFAGTFMTTLNLMYMNRTGSPVTRRGGSGGAKLSLARLMKDSREKDATGTNDVATGSFRKVPETNRKNERHGIVTQSIESEEYSRLHGPDVRGASFRNFPETNRKEDDRHANFGTVGGGTLLLEDENAFRETGLDSLALAGAVAWHYGLLESRLTRGRPMTMSFLQAVLYIIYGTCLAQRKTRIVSEHPQMWQYGPVFARVYTKMRGGAAPDRETAERIRRDDPVLYEFIARTVRMSVTKKFSDLTAPLKQKTSPWGRCNARNGDRWSTPLDDAEIAEWFGKRIANSGVH